MNQPRPIPVNGVLSLLEAVKVLRSGYEARGRLSELVPLANDVIALTVIRDHDTVFGVSIAGQIVRDLDPLYLAGIPHASTDALWAARDRLRSALPSITEFKRCLAYEGVSAVQVLQDAVEKPASLESLNSATGLDHTSLYWKYQVAVAAGRWETYLDLPHDRGWETFATEIGVYADRTEREGRDDWRCGPANQAWSRYDGLVRTIGRDRSIAILLRVAIAAELHRREHGAYPNDLDAIESTIDSSHGWLDPGETITIGGSTENCTFTLDAAPHPQVIVKITTPE
ncbi:MAG: hypothetical protein AAF488_00040 [Planctomycetota bacterium]